MAENNRTVGFLAGLVLGAGGMAGGQQALTPDPVLVAADAAGDVIVADWGDRMKPIRAGQLQLFVADVRADTPEGETLTLRDLGPTLLSRVNPADQGFYSWADRAVILAGDTFTAAGIPLTETVDTDALLDVLEAVAERNIPKPDDTPNSPAASDPPA